MQSGWQGEQTRQFGGNQQMGMRLQDVQTPQEQSVTDAVVWATEACAWCADQCIQLADPNMVECVRLCIDVAELGETALAMLPRRSRHAATVLQAFQQAAEACAQECSRHQHAHCQECAEALGHAIDAIQGFLGGGAQQMSQQMGETGMQTQSQMMSPQ